jgi:hypothetical protein
MTPVSPVGGEVDDLDRELAMVWMAETKGEFLTAAAVVRARLEAAESARDEALAALRGATFRAEVACEGYAHLMDEDVPGGVVDLAAYQEGAHDAAEAIRAVLTPSAPTEQER